MIEIKIVDPHLADKEILRKTAAYLLSLAGDELVSECQIPAMSTKPTPVEQLGPDYFLASHEIQDSAHNENIIEDYVPVNTWKKPQPQETIKLPGTEISKEFNSDLDTAGYPWDSRIHARTKTKTSDGAWKLMRGIDMQKVIAVQNELKKAVNAPRIPSTTLQFDPAVHASETVTMPFNPAVHSTVVTTLPAPPQMVAVPPPPPVTEVCDFQFMVKKVTALITNKSLTHETMNAILQEFGLPSIHVMATRPDLLPSISNRIDQVIGGAA
jgi:hypothetical protein